MLASGIIHQTWKSKEIPQPYASWVDTVRKLNPEYQYWLWTDEDNRKLIETRYPWFLPTYDAYKHDIERVDSVRYFILYTYGGVYIDLDMECLKPIDFLFGENREVYLSLEAGPEIKDWTISNAFMASGKDNAFFKHIIHNLQAFKGADITHQDVFENTGPRMVTREWYKHRGRFDFGVVPLSQICPLKVVGQHPRFAGRSLDEIRTHRDLCLLHHNTEAWNVQVPPPTEEPEGYTLLVNQDIEGCDIDYCAPSANLAQNRFLCDGNPDAIGFNYNGYIKGAGGKLKSMESESSWVKEGVTPWICIKKGKLGSLQ